MANYKKRILIDLDGVLNDYEGGFDEKFIPEIKVGAKQFVKNLSEEFEIYLFTSRNLMLASKWLVKNKIDEYFKDVTNIKLPSYLYIDDRTICFEGSYDNTLDKINKFKTYWN